MGPEKTQAWWLDSAATLRLHAGNPTEHRGWAASRHNTEEARHGADTPDTHTAGGAQQDSQQPSLGGDMTDK